MPRYENARGVWGPKVADHPSIGRPCPLCGIAFRAGDMTTGAFEVPASDEDRQKRDAGKAYTAMTREVHIECGVR